MIKLDRPHCSADDVFTKCISGVIDPSLKERLIAVTPTIITESDKFDTAASNGQVHTLPPQTSVLFNGLVVTKKEMETVYTQRMAHDGAPGRGVYDALRNSSPNNKCPLCGHRQATTLDHYLPKSRYPALAVAPLNLIPACKDCNTAKMESFPTSQEDAMLHPYFDDINSGRWLYANVIQKSPVVLIFSVIAPTSWSATMQPRVNRHFQTLGLARLYSIEAADELSSIKSQLQNLFNNGGTANVQSYLQQRAESCSQDRRNGWRTAMYEALFSNSWFCSEGFNSIG